MCSNEVLLHLTPLSRFVLAGSLIAVIDLPEESLQAELRLSAADLQRALDAASASTRNADGYVCRMPSDLGAVVHVVRVGLELRGAPFLENVAGFDLDELRVAEEQLHEAFALAFARPAGTDGARG